MNATHFRTQAARARDMAKEGDDLRLSRMLLDLADELEAEADLIDAEQRATGLDQGAAEQLIPTALVPALD